MSARRLAPRPKRDADVHEIPRVVSPEIALEISAVIARYSRAMDTAEWPLMHTVFTHDASIDMNDALFAEGRNAVVSLIRAAIECCSQTHHMNSNIEILSLEGPRARVRHQFRAWHRRAAPNQSQIFEAMGHYEDDFVLTEAGWRIHHRAERSTVEIGDAAVFFADAADAFARAASASAPASGLPDAGDPA